MRSPLRRRRRLTTVTTKGGTKPSYKSKPVSSTLQQFIINTNKRKIRNVYYVGTAKNTACCALVGELAFNESNSYQIVNTNGLYLVASKLLLSAQPTAPSSASTGNVSGSGSGANDQGGGFGAAKEMERLHCNVWRTIRLLFSAERHRPLIKKIIPFNMFEQFVDIGNFKKDLRLYQPLVDSFYKLNVSRAYLLFAKSLFAISHE